MEGSSQSFETNVPYAPFVDLFQDYFGLQQDQADSAKMDRIRAQIDDLMPGQGQAVAPFFGSLLDLQMSADDEERIKFQEPPLLRGSIFGHVHSLLAAHLARQPLVLFFDDLHWVDPTSLELLESFVGLVERLPLLVIAAFRPRRQEPSWRFHETAQRDYSYRYQTVALNPLDQDQARQLVANLLTVEDMPEGVRQKILDRSEGNPFFVEEIIRSLLDDELIVQENGHWRATQEIGELAIPDTVIGVITARLDRLEENSRQIAQAAAVLGREFSMDILADVAEAPQLLEQALLDLQRRELIREKSRLPQLTYIFKHVLTQQAAYNSILLSNRRELHRRAVESLLVHYPERAAAIAFHCLQARMQTRAMPFLVEAGKHATHAYAAVEAMDYFEQAIALRDVVDDLSSLREAYEGLGQVLTFIQRIPEAVQTYEALLALGEAKGDVPTQVSALNKLASTYALNMGQFEKGDQFLARADLLGSQNNDQSGAAESALIRCQVCSMQGDFNGVVLHMGNLVKVGEALGSKEYMVAGLEHISNSLVWLTRYDEAYKTAQDALVLAREIGDREHEAMLLTVPLPLCAVREGDLEQALRYLAEGLLIGEKIGALIPKVFGHWLVGDIAQLQGDYEKALQHGRIALEYALPVEEMMPWFVVLPLSSLGSYYLQISDQHLDEITQFHLHALKVLENPAGTLFGGGAWAELGYCSLALGDLALADESFQKGLNHTTMLIEVERPRLLAGTALLAQARGNLVEACSLVQEAIDFAQERKMRHLVPLLYLILGKIQGDQGEIKKALTHFSTSETAALEMGMRPIIWQARAATADLLQAKGDNAGAAEKRIEAQAMVEEIAGLFTDQALREAYLQSARRKLKNTRAAAHHNQ